MRIAEIMLKITNDLVRDDNDIVVVETARLKLHELAIKYGTSCGDCRMGLARRVADRCKTGSISIHNIRHLLEETGRLCVNSQCHDDDF